MPKDMEMSKNFYLISEVAKYFSLSKRTVYRRIEKGEIAATRIGPSLRIPASEIMKFKPKRRRKRSNKKAIPAKKP